MMAPQEAMKRLADQMGWLSQMLGEGFVSQIQEAAMGNQAGREGRPCPPDGQTAGHQAQATPPLEIYLTPQEVVLCAALPGLASPDHLSVCLTAPNELILEAFVQPMALSGTVLRRERFAGYCHRTVTLPASVLQTGARATYTEGIVEIRLARAEPGGPDSGVSLLQVN